jgi:hypothetical protein
MDYILTKLDFNPIYPYSLSRLRAENPNISFPDSPSEGDLEPFHCFSVALTEPPLLTDSRTQRISESEPAQNSDGKWEQTWTIRDATEQEIAEWDLINNPIPQPDWVAFKLLSQSSPEFKGIITQALVSDPVNALGLQIELNEVIRGEDSRPFYAALSSVFNSVEPDPAILRSFAAEASAMHLPEEFVNMLLSLIPAD